MAFAGRLNIDEPDNARHYGARTPNTNLRKDHMSAPVDAVVLWSVTLNDGDWYWVFARSAIEAERVVRTSHYSDTGEFRKKYEPKISKIEGSRRIVVGEDGVGQFTRTAKAWCKGQRPGPFVSNTYDY